MIMRNHAILARLAGDTRGVTAVEFAMIAPVFFIMLFGAFDLGHNLYTRQIMQGQINAAARASTVEGAEADVIDENVREAVVQISPEATVTFSRKAYSKFSDISRAEEYADTNANGTCDANEQYEDANANDSWDKDRGKDGNGSARDAVLYNVHVKYPRLFPIGGFIGLPAEHEMLATTVLRNQPYGMASDGVAEIKKCP